MNCDFQIAPLLRLWAQLMSFKIRSHLKAIKHFLNFCETSIRLVDMPFPHFTVCNPPPHPQQPSVLLRAFDYLAPPSIQVSTKIFFVINFLSLCLNEHRQSIFSRTILKCYIVFHLKVFQIDSWTGGWIYNIYTHIIWTSQCKSFIWKWFSKPFIVIWHIYF